MTDQHRQMADSLQRLATLDELLGKHIAAFQQGECDAERVVELLLAKNVGSCAETCGRPTRPVRPRTNSVAG